MSDEEQDLDTCPSSVAELVPEPIQYFAKDETYTDIVFVVEGKRIHFTKSKLGLCSPVFVAMFEADFAEKGAKEIPLPGKKYDDMVEFFKHLHPAYGPMTQVTDGNLLSLLSLADEYQVTSVREKCKQYISQQARLTTASRNFTDEKEEISVDSVLSCLLACDQYKFQDHKEELVQAAAWKGLKKITQSPIYASFENNSMVPILRKICEHRETLLDQIDYRWETDRLDLPWCA